MSEQQKFRPGYPFRAVPVDEEIDGEWVRTWSVISATGTHRQLIRTRAEARRVARELNAQAAA